MGKPCKIDYELELKECSKCKEMLPFGDFYKSNNNKIGLSFLCKKCEHLRKRLQMAIKKDQKSGSAVRDLGCSIDYLKSYLEDRFYIRDTGEEMSWDNYGVKGWNIDHIRPLAFFDLTAREQFLEACHYTNFQPLWWEDNIAKGAKYEEQSC